MSQSEEFAFDAVAKIPADGDNVAIASRRLAVDTVIARGSDRFCLSHTILEGHRFALRPIGKGDPLLSWGLPFGTAKRDLRPGEYVCNQGILSSLSGRSIDFPLPEEANFEDYSKPYDLDGTRFVAGTQVEPAATPATFQGYRRPGPRGAGTRNFVVVLATTSQSSAFAEALAQHCREPARQYPNIDGVVAVTHTEGGASKPNNLELVLRTLSGFMVHPNVGAILAVDYGNDSFGNDDLSGFMLERDYPLEHVLHRFFRISGDFQSELQKGDVILRSWFPQVNALERSDVPVSHLRIALQCGGSDAFSGVSGNALAGWVAKLAIQNGGCANLGETDELIGAEPYVLSNVKDLDTARLFLDTIQASREQAGHHGTSAEQNPGGGNKFRGLYNITLKSIGAARKRDPEVRLDYVIDYAERMRDGGFYFMNSPGNDLESIAGQVASGANMIFFITGNGSITNFPFVPTLKFVTTTGRFNLLANEMDVNAGRYNDGTPMDELGQETFELALRVAGGERSKGERAGHAQVQIWRNWRQTDDSQFVKIRSAPAPEGSPLPVVSAPAAELRFDALHANGGFACDQVGLVMPTSLCSGQVARLIANHLNEQWGGRGSVSRYVALAHTEGCGARNNENLLLQTLLGYVSHPSVNRAILLEHGCEYVHNDAVRHYLRKKGLPAERFGWASIQMDGGIDKVRDKVAGWFKQSVIQSDWPESRQVGVSELSLAILTRGSVSDPMMHALARLTLGVVGGGGTVVIPENASVARSGDFRERILASPGAWVPSLAYGQPAEQPGLHVMEAPTEDPSETLTGLGGTGVGVMLAPVAGVPLQANPMIPLIQMSDDPAVQERYHNDLDLLLERDTPLAEVVEGMLDQIGQVASRQYTPKLFARGVTNFQLTRGLLGVSM